MTRDLLRHSLATVAYRGWQDPARRASRLQRVRAAPGSRSAGEILAHMSDLLDWSLSLVRGPQAWHNSTPATWEQDTARFFTGLAAFDAALASGSTIEMLGRTTLSGPLPIC